MKTALHLVDAARPPARRDWLAPACRWGLGLLFGLGAANLPAQTMLYWDTNGSASGSGSSPSATWSSSAANWSTSSLGTSSTTAWTSGALAVFSAGSDASGAYTVTVSGTQTAAGLTVTRASPTLSGGTVAFSGGSTVNVASGSTLTFNSQISSTTGFTKTGLGTLVVGGTSNVYTGATTVSAGTLQLGAANALSSSSALSVASGATFDLNWGNNQTVGALSGAGSINIRGNTFTVGDSTDSTFSGVLSDNGAYGSLVKQGTGTLTLTGANTFAGTTTINAGVLNVQNSAALGGATYGNAVANGAALQLQGGIALNESSFSITGSGIGGTGAFRNISGANSYTGALALSGASTVASDGGSLTLSGAVSLGTGTTLTTRATGGDLIFSGTITGSSDVMKTGSGTVTFSGSGANSYGGTTTVAEGTLQLNKTAGTNALGGGPVVVGDGVGLANSANLTLLASNQIPDYTSSFTINSDGRFNLNNFSESLDTIAGTGAINLGTSGSLTVGVSSGSSTFAGSITGAGTLQKSGSGTLTFDSNINFTGTLLLSGGTLALNGITLTVGTLHITGNSVLDFGNSSASILNASNFIIDSGVTLTITNWANNVDYFYAQNWTGATLGGSGTTPMNQITFTGFSSNSTAWQPYDHQISPYPSPVPEPAAYGWMFTGFTALLYGWRRLRTTGLSAPA
jgi:autotransporter-associated beta strand protein